MILSLSAHDPRRCGFAADLTDTKLHYILMSSIVKTGYVAASQEPACCLDGASKPEGFDSATE